MKLNITDENVINRIGFPFYYWANYGNFPITEQDLKYLEKIKRHPCFSIVSGDYQTLLPILDWANIRINRIVFYEHFYKDPNCPHGIKDLLFTMIGADKGNLEEHNMINLLYFRYHSIELWINSIKQKSSP